MTLSKTGSTGHELATLSAEFETSFALAAFPERVHRAGVDYSKVKLDLKSPKDAAEDRTFYQECA